MLLRFLLGEYNPQYLLDEDLYEQIKSTKQSHVVEVGQTVQSHCVSGSLASVC